MTGQPNLWLAVNMLSETLCYVPHGNILNKKTHFDPFLGKGAIERQAIPPVSCQTTKETLPPLPYSSDTIINPYC
jgi:hypothetical protein